jgi:hypothetical protein
MNKKIYSAICCLFLTTLCLPLLGWSTVLEVSMQPNHESWLDWDPSSAVDSQGNSYVTWTSYGSNEGGPTTDIYMVKIFSSTQLGYIANVSIHPDAVAWEEMDPKVAVGTLNNSYVTYCGWDGTSFQIYWVKMFLSFIPGWAQKISVHPDNANHNNYHPEIASDTQGNSHVVWYGSDGNDNEIYWVKLNAAGTPGTVQKISTHPDNIAHHDFNPRVAADASGNSYVVWSGSDGNDSEIYWVKVSSLGTPGTVQKVSTHPDNITHPDGDPRIAVDGSGNSYITWYGSDGHDYEIYWVKVDSLGVPGTVQKISTHQDNVANGDFSPEIAIDPSGNSYVVWKGSDGNDYEIYWVKVSSLGTPGTVQKVSTHPDNLTNRDYYPRVGVDSSGTSYVTWAGDDGDSSNLAIYYVTVDSSGNPGTVQKASAVPDDLDFDETEYLDILVDSSGYSYVYWSGLSGQYDWQIYFINNRV